MTFEKSFYSALFFVLVFLFASFNAAYCLPSYEKKKIRIPYRKAGLNERQAAAHLLSRFTFGSRPGDVDMVIKLGLKKWFEQELEGVFPEDTVLLQFSKYHFIQLSNTQIENLTPNRIAIFEMAVKECFIDKDSIKSLENPINAKILNDYSQKHGFMGDGSIIDQLTSEKILRATYSTNQLREVMTDFWFNHFNISIKGAATHFIPGFEREVVRPNVFGNFQDLLIATAHSPAMLYYLDNASSSYTDTNTLSYKKQVHKPKNLAGLNENYAREIMELHTIGVDGGYNLSDVTQAARVLTGWTVFPFQKIGQEPRGIAKQFATQGEEAMEKQGYFHQGDFLFDVKRHDPGEKIVLGHKFPKGGGYEEGLELLTLLAHHPSTTHFICKELAIRFVNDHPTSKLIDNMANTFLKSNGNIKQVLITMVEDPEFWNSSSTLRQKTKSPLEYMVSALRSLKVNIIDPKVLNNWLTRMGQQVYHYLAPTGFPDRGDYWINTGSLLNRMNFGLSLSSGKIDGIKMDLLSLNNYHEPESNQAALFTYSSIIMPERDLDPTIKRLSPLLNNPEISQKINITIQNPTNSNKKNGSQVHEGSLKNNQTLTSTFNNNSLAQVVGIIIGSPEFQRR